MTDCKLIRVILFSPAIIATIIVSSCAYRPTDAEVNAIKAKVMAITIGYKDGTTLVLSAEYADSAGLLDYCSVAALSIDRHSKCNVPSNEAAQEWRSQNKYIQMDFESPTTIATRVPADEKDRDYITTNEEGFLILYPTRIIFPLSGDYEGLIWTIGEGMAYGLWGSGNMSSSELERMVDEWKGLSIVP